MTTRTDLSSRGAVEFAPVSAAITANDNALAGGLASVRRRTPLSRRGDNGTFGSAGLMATISAMAFSRSPDQVPASSWQN